MGSIFGQEGNKFPLTTDGRENLFLFGKTYSTSVAQNIQMVLQGTVEAMLDSEDSRRYLKRALVKFPGGK